MAFCLPVSFLYFHLLCSKTTKNNDSGKLLETIRHGVENDTFRQQETTC